MNLWITGGVVVAVGFIAWVLVRAGALADQDIKRMKEHPLPPQGPIEGEEDFL